MKVNLSYKAIYRGKIALDKDDKTIIRVIHMELETDNFNRNLKKFVSIYGRSSIGFKNGYRIRFWSYLDLVKSNKAKGTLTKAYERQKFFLEAITVDYYSSVVYLDTIPEGSSLLTI